MRTRFENPGGSTRQAEKRCLHFPSTSPMHPLSLQLVLLSPFRRNNWRAKLLPPFTKNHFPLQIRSQMAPLQCPSFPLGATLRTASMRLEAQHFDQTFSLTKPGCKCSVSLQSSHSPPPPSARSFSESIPQKILIRITPSPPPFTLSAANTVLYIARAERT